MTQLCRCLAGASECHAPRRNGSPGGGGPAMMRLPAARPGHDPDTTPTGSLAVARPMTEHALPQDAPAPDCPKCGGAMWDNRASKRNPRAPDFKCRDKSCDGVVWPPRDAAT